MSKRNDLRNGREQGNCKPGLWPTAKVRAFVRRVIRTNHSLLCKDIGEYDANLVTAELQNRMKADWSLAAIHEAGYKTIGESEG